MNISVCVCAAVSEVVSPDSAAPVAPPVVVLPIASTSAQEGEPARFQCRVRGDGKKLNVSLKCAWKDRKRGHQHCNTNFVFQLWFISVQM